MKKYIIGLFSAMLLVGNVCAESVSGTVQDVTVLESGDIIFTISGGTTQFKGCSTDRSFVITKDHAGKNQILSMLLVSYTAKKPANFWAAVDRPCVPLIGSTYPVAITFTVL